ncbi:glutamate ABC transporter substrate-binding protein [Sphaerisporangium sp. B11E5]|uniref:glutamate ABC transporter substrate-binding protein n=1 Tax=Sphaerisporangium sp. B11E5 TaxID=3153563 RepID=UPI00325CA070
MPTPHRPGRRVLAGALALTAVLSLIGGCARGNSILDKPSLVIGVKPDQPGLGMKADGGYTGFDVDMAREVARRLGKPVSFVDAPSARRETMLQQGLADLVFATYSITPQRKTKVSFAGPYYVAHQDTLVRAAESGIDNVRDLRGRRLCEVTGSNSWRRVKEERKIPVELVQSKSYKTCVDDLLAGRLDAVSTDDLILAGFSTGQTRIVNAPFSDERYGVGIRTGDIDGCEAVNTALTEMYQDGTASKLLEKWFAKSGLKLNHTVPQFEGCG